jgi:Ion channel
MKLKASTTSVRRAVAVLIDRTSLLGFAFYFAVGVLGFGLVYYVLTPGSNGLVNEAHLAVPITPGVAIYFSVVTVSTLGYGDITPQGLSKFLVCIEVIFGLTMMGIIVAKLTSARLSYHVRRLFSSDTQRRLEVYSAAFDIVQAQFSRLSPKIGRVFQETPNLTVSHEQAECVAEFGLALSEFHLRSLAFSRDISYELGQGDFFSDAPTDALQKTATSIEQSLFLLGQLILSFPIPELLT